MKLEALLYSWMMKHFEKEIGIMKLCMENEEEFDRLFEMYFDSHVEACLEYIRYELIHHVDLDPEDRKRVEYVLDTYHDNASLWKERIKLEIQLFFLAENDE